MPKLMSRSTFDQIDRLLRSGKHTYVAIGNLVGVDYTAVRTIARGRHFYQADEQEQTRRRGQLQGRSSCGPQYLPTPEEIAEACERIHAERRRSASEDDADGWTPPVFSERMLTGV
ncbi:MAG: hypothetical protein GXP26_02930 [Planctomycetes bacterium]|nr:hypothetical protein [Planctomycetota bacterium]